MRKLISIVCILALPAAAQPTGPNVLPPTGPKPMAPIPAIPNGLPSIDPAAPGAVHYLFTQNGQCAWWWVYSETGQRLRAYCGTVADFANIGGRVNTIRGAADPAKSLDDLGKRITLRPITCAGLACSTAYAPLQPIVAEMNAELAK